MEGMEKINRKPIKITDTTFRDGHQSSLATRMRTEDGLEPMPEKVKPKSLEDVKKEDEAIAKAKAEAQVKTT